MTDDTHTPACSSSISTDLITTYAEEVYRARCKLAVMIGKVTETKYRAGAILSGWPAKWKQGTGKRAKRGVISHQSNKSLNRAAWMIANSCSTWNMMCTLTFRSPHRRPKACLKRFLRLVLGGRLDQMPHAWVMEFQQRGVVHFHVLMCEDHVAHVHPHKGHWWTEIGSGKRRRTVLSGPLGEWVAKQWIESVGDYSTEFLAFQMGGIVEKVSSHELASIYLGSYLGKLRQKMLPVGMEPMGRWWYMPPTCAPIPESDALLQKWVDGYPLRYVRRIALEQASDDSGSGE